MLPPKTETPIPIKQLSLDVVGIRSLDGSGARLNNCVVDYRYSSLEYAQNQRNDAARAFQFLAEWLNVPLMIEPYTMHEASNVRYYF